MGSKRCVESETCKAVKLQRPDSVRTSGGPVVNLSDLTRISNRDSPGQPRQVHQIQFPTWKFPTNKLLLGSFQQTLKILFKPENGHTLTESLKKLQRPLQVADLLLLNLMCGTNSEINAANVRCPAF